MPLKHLLWRLSEGREGSLHVLIKGICMWPSCVAGGVETDLRLALHDSKPEELRCPLCRRSVKIVAARSISDEDGIAK
jgi:hypothetical protein